MCSGNSMTSFDLLETMETKLSCSARSPSPTSQWCTTTTRPSIRKRIRANCRPTTSRSSTRQPTSRGLSVLAHMMMN